MCDHVTHYISFMIVMRRSFSNVLFFLNCLIVRYIFEEFNYSLEGAKSVSFLSRICLVRASVCSKHVCVLRSTRQ
jgi:hypothetical protein